MQQRNKNIICKACKALLFFTSGIFASYIASAQYSYEYAVAGGGGLSSLQYKITKGSTSQGWGGYIGGDFLIKQKQWGLGSGIHGAFYNSTVNASDLTQYNEVNNPAYPGKFYFQARINNYSEKQEAFFLNIPLKVQYRQSQGRGLYAEAGVAVGIPLSTHYKGHIDTLITTGFSEYTGNTYADLPVYGFGTYTNVNSSGSIGFKLQWTINGQVGMQWRWQGMLLYTGAYVQYGLNNIRRNADLPLVNYQQSRPSQFSFNSITNAVFDHNGQPYSLVQRVNVLAAGLTVRLTLAEKHKVFTDINRSK
jgi:hypothetical protein